MKIESSGIGIINLSHISLNTKNLEAAEKFYIEVLGGEKVFDFSTTENFKYGTFIAVGNGTFIEIFKSEAYAMQDAQSVNAKIFRHLCFQVKSIDMAINWLKKFGYHAVPKSGKVDGVKQFFIIGPDEVEIEFHEYEKTNPQYKFLY